MKQAILLTILFLSLSNAIILAQSGKTVSNVKLTDANNTVKTIPYLGDKVLFLMYVDADVHEITETLTEALNDKKYPVGKFGAIGVVNCKDSWFPNSAIVSQSRKKQQQYPESVILLDKNLSLSNAWGFGNTNNAAVIVIIGKDLKIKYIKYAKSEKEVRNSIPEVLKKIDAELQK